MTVGQVALRPGFPIKFQKDDDSERRDLFIAAALQGCCASGRADTVEPSVVAKFVVRLVDEVMKAR